jgi:hypothetical protein
LIRIDVLRNILLRSNVDQLLFVPISRKSCLNYVY